MNTWQLALQREATGALTPHQNTVRLSKTNARGVAEARWGTPFPVKAGVKYLFRVRYSSQNATVSNLLLVRLTPTPDETPGFNVPGNEYFAIWTGQSMMRNDAPRQFSTRRMTSQSDKDGEVFLRVLLYGNPCDVQLQAPEIQEGAPETIKPSNYQPAETYTDAQVAQILAKRPDATAKIAPHNGAPAIFLNGQFTLPVIYKPRRPGFGGGDYAAFEKHGISLATVSIPTGKTSTSEDAGETPFWLGRDQYDFSVVDENIAKTLRRNPQAHLILDVWLAPYANWGRENRDEVVRNAKGELAVGPASYTNIYTSDIESVEKEGSGKFWIPSWQSAKFRADSARALSALAAHIKTQPYAKAVSGFFITGGNDGQFVVHFHDHSEPSQKAFRAYVEQKYGSINSLNTSWKTNFAGFGEVEVPNRQEIWDTPTTYLAPGAAADYRVFTWRDTYQVREEMARALKTGIGKSVICLTYASPYNHAFVEMPSLDAVGLQPDYPNRAPGFPTGFMHVSTSALGNKLLFNELDLRSTSGEGWPSNEVFGQWVSVPETPEEWRAIHRKVAGISLAEGYGAWYYDMGRYFDPPEVQAEIGKVQTIARVLAKSPQSDWRADVCYVETEEQDRYIVPGDAIVNSERTHFNGTWINQVTSGVATEKHYLKDILKRPDLQNFKVYVFAQNAYISDEERAQIVKLLQNRGRVLVWVYSSGYISQGGKSTEAMSKLTGISIATQEVSARRTLNYLRDVHPYTRGVAPFSGSTDMYAEIYGNQGVQSFQVEDNAATPLARYAETGQVAAAVKVQNGWTSVFIGAPNALSNEVLNNIARSAGAFVAGDAGQQLNMNANFVSLHGLRAGQYTLHLPRGRSQVVDADSGKILSRGPKYTFPIEAQTSYWFLLR